VSKLSADRGRLPLGGAGRIALALTAVILTGCGPSETGPSSTVTGLSLAVHSTEWETDRNLVVAGKYATAEIATVTDEGCPADVPCPISADVEIRSSDPNVLSPLQERVRAPAIVALVTHAPGSAMVSVTKDGLTESKRVDVVAEPLPLDAMQVIVVTELNDLPAQYDASNSLTSVEISATGWGWVAFDVRAFRSGAEVFGIRTSAASYSYTTAEVTSGCRPLRIDRDCEVFHDIWMRAINQGDVEVAVSARNLSTEFTAHIVP
jgi:hypothetical protein